MDIETHRKTYEPNPQLEALRAKGLEESANETHEWIFDLINRTSVIHAGFLFEDRKTLQNICLLVDETQNKITDAGWEAFGNYLGLSSSVLKVINYNNFNKEDPCYNTLLAYVQYENASIGKIIETLYKIGRIDVISRIKKSLNDLADIVLQCQNSNNTSSNSIEDTSDYDSLPGSEGYRQSTNSNILDSPTDVLIRPKIIPPAPFIFQNIQANPELTSQCIQQALNSHSLTDSDLSCDNEKYNGDFVKNVNKITNVDDFNAGCEIQILRESIQNSSIVSKKYISNYSPQKKKYGIKVFLTFAEDGEKYAQEICKCFRKARNNYPSIGVLILSEHVAEVNKDPHQFIAGAFYQVDYVCPIITPGYYNLIAKKQKATLQSNMHIDSSFVPYIYRLMSSYFISNDCLNDKVRCIIPDPALSFIPINILMSIPIFGAWVKLSEIEELAYRLLKSAFKKNCKMDILNTIT